MVIKESLMRIETGSSLGTWRTCRKKYQYLYEKMLVPKGYHSAFGLGTMVHAAIEDHWSNSSDKFRKSVDDHVARYPEQAADVQYDAALAEIMFRNWVRNWTAHEGSMSNRGLKVLDAEGEWAMSIGTDIYAGKRDAHLIIEADGKHLLYELKTASQGSEAQYLHRLQLDNQLASNVVALRSEGKQVDGVLYDVIWKPLLRQRKGETEEQLLQRIAQDYEEHMVEYYTRSIIDVPQWRQDVVVMDVAEQLRELKTGTRYRNPSACMQYNSLCPYFDACSDPDNPAMEQMFEKKIRKHEELSEQMNDLPRQLESEAQSS